MASTSITKREPLVAVGLVVSAIVAVAAVFGIVINPATLTSVVLIALPIVTSIVGRKFVSPAV